MPVVLDNNKLGAVGEYIKENTQDGAIITISSPIFTIYAFEELRKVLEKSNKFRFLFNEPTFIKNIISNSKEVKEEVCKAKTIEEVKKIVTFFEQNL